MLLFRRRRWTGSQAKIPEIGLSAWNRFAIGIARNNVPELASGGVAAAQRHQRFALSQVRRRRLVVVLVLFQNSVKGFDRVFVILLAHVGLADVKLRVGRQSGAGIIFHVIAELLEGEIQLHAAVVAISIGVRGLGAHSRRRR